MKKVYILAFQRATNYGAVLQLYALVKVIEKLNFDVEVIDYIPPWMRGSLKSQPSILSFVKRSILKLTFHKFLKNLNLTSKKFFDKNSLSQDLTKADFYIVGSDQVWNQKIINVDDTYFLSFVPGSAKRISYAASMGNNPLTGEFKNIALNLIQKMDSVSVREEYVRDFLKNARLDVDPQVVLDPTLLLNKSDYERVTSDKEYRKPYIAVYSCMHDDNMYAMARHLKEKLNLPLVNLGFHFDGIDKNEFLLGPENWLNRIKQCECLITNSFHGTAFAVIHRVNFFTVPNENASQKGLNARFTELLDSISLSSRLVSSAEELDVKINNINIDFSKASSLLEKRKKKSIYFLKKALNIGC